MNERLKIIRLKLKLTQDDFAKKINVTRSAISNYEKGTRNIMNRVIADICREFNVNEEWIRHGTGEMFIQNINNTQGGTLMDNELLNILKSIQTKIDSIENKVISIEERMDKGFNNLSHRMDEISQGIGNTISFELSDELSSQLKELKTDVKFIKRKVQDTEEDVFVIQDHLKLIK
ncbi:helix-turn-helix transcriptional regulator [uncultured Clostridium sp.]|uniref:helix-turn-helix domain-containing protein n=1 Tax=uncultured Clostridium sp. TaxID=59620 RepID=UPI002673E46B|nr:helix-turn-helix transcriptional regulator [uncultured Clostridium sp.]